MAARQYTPDAIKFMAYVMYNGKAPLHDRITAAKELMDRGHGKAQQSIEILEPQVIESEQDTLADLQKEIERRGLKNVINLIPTKVDPDDL